MALTSVFVLFLLVSLAFFAWWLVMLIEALRIPAARWSAAGQSQLLYVLLMVFLGVIGTLVYVLVPRPQLR
jgi:hypothetical protein